MEDFLLLKDYQIGEQIGRGGFAVVYSGRNLRNGESVAIKIIDKSYVRRNDLAGRVEQEIKIHSRLDHPSVVKLYNWFEDDNHVYLILELCENGELQKFLKARGRPFDEIEAREIMHQVVEGFIYLHSQGILHRDLSLANLLITKGMKLIPSNLSAEAKDLISKLLKKVPQERLKLKDVKGHPFMQRKDKYTKASFSSSDSGMYTMTTVSDASGSSKNQPNSRFTKDFDPSLFNHERNILRRSHSASTKIREPLAPIREGLSRFNSFEESKERFCGDNVLVNHGSGDSTKFKKYLLEPSANKNYEKRHDFYSKNDNVDGVIVSELKLGYESGDCERAHNTESLSDWKNEYNQRGRLQENFRQDNRGRTTDNEFRQKHLRETSDFNSNDGINYSGRYDSPLRSCENLEKIEKRNRSYPREKDYLRPRSLDREVRYKNQPRDLKTVTDRLRTQSVESKIAPVQMNSPLRSNSIDYFQKDLSTHMADDQTSGRRQDFIRCAAAPLHRIHAPHPTMSSHLSCPGDLPFQSGGQKINCSHYMNCPVSCAHFSACACQTQHKLLHEPYGVPLSSHLSNHSAPAAVETIPHRAQQRDGEVLKTSKEGLNFPPLNTARLKATRQRTKNVVMQILENGEVCLEFIKSKKGLERIVDVCRISDDGLRVAIYQPNGSRGIPVSETPPLLPSGGADFIHSYENLPQRFWKKYEYANRFVQLVKAKTPKVTYYSSMAKCCLMENSPNNDFEVNFYNGSRILKSNSGLSLTEPGHSPKLLPENDPSKLSGEILVSYEHYVECHEKCKQYENVLEEVAGRNPELQLFPVIFGRKPSQNSGLLTENKENQSPTVSSAMMPSFGTSVSTISSRWESGNSQSDRKLGRTKGINDVSVAEGYSGSRVKRADVPGLGRIVERTNGELDIYFSDKYELSISPYTAAIKVRRQTDPVSIRFPPNSVLPADVEHRLSQVPKFLQHLKKLPSGLR
ncbi:hypothetical protein QYM36_005603 [Artemia franciscana]|uniref:Serine/threonine-protein kinase SAK n=1 Tax=Artemia franciscana TaxID=6661 RepID=A0AA88L637_ARTSF|nr:hypothetical protein QYM36_005603 [Artemia franciscana]